jgi:AcrR family transcriptional regulator
MEAIANQKTAAVRRRAILDAALRCFADKGYAATWIQDVRELSGASTGSIYHHFGNKEGLAAALYLDGLERYQRTILARLEAAPHAEAGVRGVIEEHFAWVRANPELARFLAIRLDPAVLVAARSDIRRLNREFSSRARAWLEAERDAGALANAPVEVLMACVLGPCQALTRPTQGREPAVGSADVAALSQVVWQGVQPVRAPEPARKTRPKPDKGGGRG